MAAFFRRAQEPVNLWHSEKLHHITPITVPRQSCRLVDRSRALSALGRHLRRRAAPRRQPRGRDVSREAIASVVKDET